MQLNVNSKLQSGKYRIIRVLGQGGFGITYLAENTLLDKMVAIKEFFPKEFCGRDNTSHLTLGTQNNAETVEKLKTRFLKEAKNIAKLDHPGIVKIHDVFEENNTAYYVMDYIDGESLSDIVKRDGPMPETKAIKYIRKVGDALDYIHSRRMTHFDVKPANIMVRRSDSNPILIDFGLSKQYDKQGDATSTLMQAASDGFSPIELYNIGSVNTFSPQTDIYSLGATLYYLVVGQKPPEALTLFETGLYIPNSLSETTKNAIRNAMETSRSKRPKCVSIFVAKLSTTITTEPSQHSCNNDTEDDTIYLDTSTFTAPSEPSNSSSDFDSKKYIWSIGIILASIILLIILNNKFSATDTGYTSEQLDPDSVVVEEVLPVLEDVAVIDTISPADNVTTPVPLSTPNPKKPSLNQKAPSLKPQAPKMPIDSRKKPLPRYRDEVTTEDLNDKGISENNNKVFDVVDKKPQFPGGEEALLKYIADNIIYPADAFENNIQGRVVVQFVVTKTGDVENVKVIEGKTLILIKKLFVSLNLYQNSFLEKCMERLLTHGILFRLDFVCAN